MLPQVANSGLLEGLHPDVCDVSLALLNLLFNVRKHILLNWGADCARFKFRELRSKINLQGGSKESIFVSGTVILNSVSLECGRGVISFRLTFPRGKNLYWCLNSYSEMHLPK